MIFLLIPLILLILLVLNGLIVALFRARCASARWWVALSFSWAVGIAIGMYGGFYLEYQPSPDLRVAGAPVPGAFFHLEGPPDHQTWVDYITPAPLLFAGSNIVLMPVLLACPVGLAFWMVSRRRRRVS